MRDDVSGMRPGHVTDITQLMTVGVTQQCNLLPLEYHLQSEIQLGLSVVHSSRVVQRDPDPHTTRELGYLFTFCHLT